MSSNTEVEAGDAVTDELTAMLARLREFADAPLDDPAGAAVLVDRIAVFEQMRDTGKAAAFLRAYQRAVPDDPW